MASPLECAASAEGATDSEAPADSGAEFLRIVLVGKTGAGKSASGNTILGQNNKQPFRVAMSPCSATTRCEMQTAATEVGGDDDDDDAGRRGRRRRGVAVVDTPGFFNTRLSPQAVTAEVGRSVLLASPGPHAFLLTVRLGRYTHEERDAVQWVRATFGPEAARFTVVLFTFGDQLCGTCLSDFLKESVELSALVDGCRGGCHVFDNVGGDGEGQVAGLLDKVEKMVSENGGACYSAEMFREAERAARLAREGILAARAGMPAWREPSQEEDNAEEKTAAPGNKERTDEEEMRRDVEAARKSEEKLFWCELMTALGKGAAEGAGIVSSKDKGKLKKGKVVQKAAALAANPLTVGQAAKVVGGAVREGSKVLYKHRKTLLH